MQAHIAYKINKVLASAVLLNILLIVGYTLYLIIKNLDFNIATDYIGEVLLYACSYIVFRFCKAKVAQKRLDFEAVESSILEKDGSILLSYYYPQEDDKVGCDRCGADSMLTICNRLMNILHMNYLFVFIFLLALIATNQTQVDIKSLMVFESVFSLLFFVSMTLLAIIANEKGKKLLHVKEFSK